MKSLEITDVMSFPFLKLRDGLYTSYQLHFTIGRPVALRIGKLGRYTLPAGSYVYTGSARSRLRARILRHISMKKKLHWHIDYLLANPGITLRKIVLFRMKECKLNRRTPGDIIVRGFGSSDCRAGCGSHLKFKTDDAKRTNRHSRRVIGD